MNPTESNAPIKPTAPDQPVSVLPSSTTHEIGYATEIKNYLVSVNGLPNVGINEIVETVPPEGSTVKSRGIVIGLNEDEVEVLMLDDVKIKPNDKFIRTGEAFSVNLGDFLLGRTINPLGVPIDGRGKFTSGEKWPIDRPLRGIKTRQFIRTPFETGITTVDMLIPLARGQKQLIIGEPRAGKTGFLIDLIINQKGLEKKTICIYGLVGKSVTQIKQVVDVLEVNKASDYTVIVATASSDLASMIYLTPAVCFTIAEYFQQKGYDVLVVVDDLGAHAKYYREISLISNSSPGRESYPGDIFYQHARLMERAGNFNQSSGGGSITALPVIEINFDDFTGFIPTNLMAMTDGHLMFDSNLYHTGNRPAINISTSVSRVGRQTQLIAQKLLSDKIRSTLAQAEKLETLTRFGSEVSEETQLILKQSKQIQVFLRQKALTKIPLMVQMVILGLIFTPFLTQKTEDFLDRNKETIIDYLSSSKVLPKLLKSEAALKNENSIITLAHSLSGELEKICKP